MNIGYCLFCWYLYLVQLWGVLFHAYTSRYSAKDTKRPLRQLLGLFSCITHSFALCPTNSNYLCFCRLISPPLVQLILPSSTWVHLALHHCPASISSHRNRVTIGFTLLLSFYPIFTLSVFQYWKMIIFFPSNFLGICDERTNSVLVPPPGLEAEIWVPFGALSHAEIAETISF